MGTSVTQFIKCLIVFLAQVMISSCEINPALGSMLRAQQGVCLR